jgi:hypothetical protein
MLESALSTSGVLPKPWGERKYDSVPLVSHKIWLKRMQARIKNREVLIIFILL